MKGHPSPIHVAQNAAKAPNMSTEEPRPARSAWDDAHQEALAVQQSLDGVFRRLSAHVEQARRGDGAPQPDLAEINQLLSRVAPATRAERELSVCMRFLSGSHVSELLDFLSATGRTCLLLLAGPAAAEVALGCAGVFTVREIAGRLEAAPSPDNGEPKSAAPAKAGGLATGRQWSVAARTDSDGFEQARGKLSQRGLTPPAEPESHPRDRAAPMGARATPAGGTGGTGGQNDRDRREPHRGRDGQGRAEQGKRERRSRGGRDRRRGQDAPDQGENRGSLNLGSKPAPPAARAKGSPPLMSMEQCRELIHKIDTTKLPKEAATADLTTEVAAGVQKLAELSTVGPGPPGGTKHAASQEPERSYKSVAAGGAKPPVILLRRPPAAMPDFPPKAAGVKPPPAPGAVPAGATPPLPSEALQTGADKAGTNKADNAGADKADKAGADKADKAGIDKAEKAGANKADKAGAEKAGANKADNAGADKADKAGADKADGLSPRAEPSARWADDTAE